MIENVIILQQIHYTYFINRACETQTFLVSLTVTSHITVKKKTTKIKWQHTNTVGRAKMAGKRKIIILT